MKMSKMFIKTLREFPSDAEVISHKLLVKGGFINKLANGVYSYLPLMNRVLKKIENIVKTEMDKSGAQELLMPFVQPAQLWQESKRWNAYGKELMRFKDRHDREMCLGPTHEEVITFVAREIINSYKQLPVNLYQIQLKFRDEIRPRFGLLRSREFIMKDAYSFGKNEEELDEEYEKMAKTYSTIFAKMGLETKMVQSDTGAIGGKIAHEFMVIVQKNNGDDKEQVNAGENDIFYCKNCDYCANSNHAKSIIKPLDLTKLKQFDTEELVYTPCKKTIEEISKFLEVDKTQILKTIVYIADDQFIFVMIRGDRQIEETKLKKYLNAENLRLATDDEIVVFMKSLGFNDIEVGYLSYLNIGDNVRKVGDLTVKTMGKFVTGGNKKDYHIVGVELKESDKIEFCDICLCEPGDLCPECGSKLEVTRGIEVGNIFKLGTKYSKAMNANFLDKDGKSQPFIMGCYGIGISRTAAACVEVYNDKDGIKWPLQIAPYHVVIVPVNIKDKAQLDLANVIYNRLLEKNIEVVLDDRDQRPGVKFKDADLIGYPFRIVVNANSVENNIVEFKNRQTSEVKDLSVESTIELIEHNVKSI